MIFAAAALLPTWTAAQAAVPLNDTGQSLCYDTTGDPNVMKPCTDANTGNAAIYLGQDGRYGRDAAQAKGTLLLPKEGGGAAGFDFTPLDANGTALENYGGHVCVRDNVTKLEWEVKTSAAGTRNWGHGYTWGNSAAGDICGTTLGICNTDSYVTAVNTDGLCGASPNPWRLPTEAELLSIVNYGASSPAIDGAYFPHTQPGWYWTVDTYSTNSSMAWGVNFNLGNTNTSSKVVGLNVRLVRSGQ